MNALSCGAAREPVTTSVVSACLKRAADGRQSNSDCAEFQRLMNWRSGAVLSAALLRLAVDGVRAQEFRATVKGQVVDLSQGILPGATVTVQNQDTNEVATATTNQDESYTR